MRDSTVVSEQHHIAQKGRMVKIPYILKVGEICLVLESTGTKRQLMIETSVWEARPIGNNFQFVVATGRGITESSTVEEMEEQTP